jgi:hypothetical protein
MGPGMVADEIGSNSQVALCSDAKLYLKRFVQGAEPRIFISQLKISSEVIAKIFLPQDTFDQMVVKQELPFLQKFNFFFVSEHRKPFGFCHNPIKDEVCCNG